MARLLVGLALIALPVLELVLLIRTGQAIGFWPTLGLVLGAVVLGSVIMSRQGITVATAAKGVSTAEKKRCHELLEAVGQVLWVDDEALMDPVTALSGSGPAYVFLLVEAMAAAGAKLGLSPDMAMQLARATVAGSGELLKQSSEPAAQLRINVTSPGGTTAEALKVLMAVDGIQPVFDKALAAASRRSKELAG